MISNKFKALALSLCVVLLSACGGGGDDEYADPQCTAPCTPLRIYGDSTLVKDHIPARMLQVAVASKGFNVADGAVNGSQTADLLVWLSAGTGPALTNHGMNDCRFGVPLETYRDNLRALVDRGISILETPSPSALVDCTAYAQVMRDVSVEKNVDLIDTFALVMAIPDWRSHIPDGTHPDQWLTVEIARNRVAGVLLFLS